MIFTTRFVTYLVVKIIYYIHIYYVFLLHTHVYLFMHLYVTYIVHSAVNKDVSSVNPNKECLTKQNHLFNTHATSF